MENTPIYTDQQLQQKAEEYATNRHFPDSVAKGIKDKVSGEYFSEIESTMSIYIDGIKSQTAAEYHKPRWIVVSENNLPADNQPVYFFDRFKNKTIRKGVFLKNDQWGRKNMFCDGGYSSVNDVLFWMPEPEIQLPPTE